MSYRWSYSPFRKFLDIQRKTIEDQGLKQVEASKVLKPNEDLKALKLTENQELESIKYFFQKIWNWWN